jgi:hypothetical protein
VNEPLTGALTISNKLTSQEFIFALVVLLIFLAFFYIGGKLTASFLKRRDEAIKELADETRAQNAALLVIAKVQDVEVQMTQKNRELISDIQQCLIAMKGSNATCRQEHKDLLTEVRSLILGRSK